MIVGGSKCAMAGKDHRCVGVIQWHHVFPKARLKREFKHGAWRHPGEQTWRPIGRHGVRSIHEVEHLSLTQILADPRNRMWLCSEGAHEPVTNARIHLAVPESVWAFCAEFGLTAQLENDLRRAS